VLILSLGATSGELNPSLVIYCVANGLHFGGLELFNVFFCVLELPLVLIISLGATFGELNPSFNLLIVLLMVFFLVVLNFLMFFFVFLNLF
jgi:hypothetical protein